MTGELNLAPRRGASIWDKQTSALDWRRIDTGYWLSMAGATALIAIGAWKRSAPSMAIAAAGGLLACWAANGRSLRFADRDDLVSSASADSFPASDAPAWGV